MGEFKYRGRVVSDVRFDYFPLAYQPTLIFVEHDVMFVENLASRVVEL